MAKKTIPPGLAAFIAKRKEGAASGPPNKGPANSLAQAAASRLMDQRSMAMSKKKGKSKMVMDTDNDGV